MTKFLRAVAVASMAVCGFAQAATTTTVDLFSTNQAKITDAAIDGFVETSQVGALLDATILGGYRELIVDLKTSTVGNDASMIVSGGALSFNVGSLATATGVVRWDGVAAGASGVAISAIDSDGLGGIDLGNVLTDSFEVKILFSDAGFNFVIEAYNSDDQWSKVSITSNEHLVPFTSYIPLAAFLDCTNSFPFPGVSVSCGTDGPVDFDNLGALQVVLDPLGEYVALDLTLDQITTTVPEPGALALVGLALLGAGAASRRRKV